MDEREKYLNDVEANLKKYKGKISKMETVAKKYSASNKDKVRAEGEAIKKKYREAENIYKKLQSSSQENFEEIKKASSEVLDSLAASLDDFAHLITLKDLVRFQERITDYSCDALSETKDCVKKHPLTVVATALGVGVLIGLLVNRLR